MLNHSQKVTLTTHSRRFDFHNQNFFYFCFANNEALVLLIAICTIFIANGKLNSKMFRINKNDCLKSLQALFQPMNICPSKYFSSLFAFQLYVTKKKRRKKKFRRISFD